MNSIPLAKFGRDHWSILAYIETRCVDYKGIPDHNHFRCNAKRHPGLPGIQHNLATLPTWKTEYSTRLKGHTQAQPVQVRGHDDWDCAEDLAAAGLIEIHGSGINPWYKLTPAGKTHAAQIRSHKSNGGAFSTYLTADPLTTAC